MSEPRLRLKSIKIIGEGFSPDQPWHIVIEKGIITRITDTWADLDSDDGPIINEEGQEVFASIGWCDLRASFGEPGEEHKETFTSGCRTAAAGGFSEVLLLPNTQPTVDTKAGVQAVLHHSSNYPVKLRATAAVSVGAQGEQLTELLDLAQAGATAFTDGLHPVSDPALSLKVLQYLQRIEGLYINQAVEPRLSAGAQMHEGLVSTALGMKGVPVLAECLALKRDIDVLRYAGGRLHVSGISSAEGVQLIRAAKAEGLALTADVYVANLVYTDEDLADFDTNLKLEPPLRTAADRKALLDGLRDGTIDAIATDHRPQDTECKRLEFDLASPGMIGLQTAYSMLLTTGLSHAQLVEKLAVAPRRLLHLPVPRIAVGKKANLCLFNPNTQWVLNRAINHSKSANSPAWNAQLKGAVVGLIAHGKSYFPAYVG